MRYAAEFRRAWQGASGQAIDAGKKLLGYLANQKRLSGVDSLVKRITLEDGTVVEARWDMNIPTVRIYPGDGTEGCELYVESGLLDLGPNIASDANERFNRGLPEFDDSPATLYFGDDVTCADGVEGLNGAVRITQRQITSQCLPSAGPSVTSRLTSPAKKQAQAVLPASCWSGLMQRYVQAVYGGDALQYELAGTTLAIDGVSVGGVASENYGLIELDGTHVFVVISGTGVGAMPMRFVSECGEAVYRAWQQVRATMEAGQADRLLTIALSTAVPDVEAFQTLATFDANPHFSTYGWQFSPTEPEAHAVLQVDSDAVLKKCAFGGSATAPTASVSDVLTASLPPSDWGVKLVSPTGVSDANTAVIQNGDVNVLLGQGESFEYPIAALYDDGLVVVYGYVEAEEESPTQWGGLVCPFPVWQTPLVSEPENCVANLLPNRRLNEDYTTGYDTEEAFNSQTLQRSITINRGLLARRGATVLWSTVQQRDAFAFHMKRKPSASVSLPEFIHPVTPYALVQMTTVELTGVPYDQTHHTTEVNEVTSSLYCFSGEIDFLDAAPCDLAGHDCVRTTPELPVYGGGESVYSQIEPFDRWGKCCEGTSDRFIGYIHHAVDDVLVFPLGASSLAMPLQLSMSGRWRHNDGLFYIEPDYSRKVEDLCTNVPDLASGNGMYWFASMEVTTRLVSDDSVVASATTSQTPPPFFLNGSQFGFSDYTLVATRESGESNWTAGTYAGATAVGTETASGSFINFITGTEWTPTELTPASSCLDIEALVMDTPADAPILVATDAGTKSLEVRRVEAPLTYLCDGFNYAASRSLLDAMTYWQSPKQFGASIGMDRQSITHGYPTVQTPSFVGWA